MGKDSNLHIAESSEPADILALDYNDPEVSLNCNNTQEVRELFPPCTDYPLPPFVFTGSGKSEEESEEELAEESKKSPVRKRSRKDVCPPVGTSGAKLHTLVLPLPINLFSLFRRPTGGSQPSSPSFQNSGGKKSQKETRKKKIIHTVENTKTSIRKYLTRTKTKNETNTHNEHQEFPTPRVIPRDSGETYINRGQPEAIHSPTTATNSTSTNTVNRRISILETSLYTV